MWFATQEPSSLNCILGNLLCLKPNMALHFGIVLLVMVKSALSAIDAGVTVFGTTVAPNFKRQEGRGKFIVDTYTPV